MTSPLIRTMRTTLLLFPLVCLVAQTGSGQQAQSYEPTIESLDRHPLPDWYADAKLGIFIHWGLYSVPGWAPLVHPDSIDRRRIFHTQDKDICMDNIVLI